MRYILIIPCLLCTVFLARAQFSIEKGADVYLGANSELIVQGDFDSKENIQGDGTIVLNGPGVQHFNANGHEVPRLRVENGTYVMLNSDLAVTASLLLLKGNLRCSNYTLRLSDVAVAEGSSLAYIQTGDGGRVMQMVNHDLQNHLLPLGANGIYTPLSLSSKGAYHEGVIEISAESKPSPAKPLASKDFINNYWNVKRRGISGDMTATVMYGTITGEKSNIRPYFWNGNTWINGAGRMDMRNRMFNIQIPEGEGQIFAMQNGGAHNYIMTLLPNPVMNTATIIVHRDIAGDVNFVVNDSKGNTVRHRKVRLANGMNQVALDVTGLASGSYTVSAVSGEGIKSVKMVKR